jgi:hypothetical protein
MLQPPEDKINAAFPISQEIEFLNNDIRTKIAEKKELAFTSAYENKLKLRALNCSDGYQPVWYETIEKTKSSLQNTSCFNDADYALKNWLDIIKVGLILEQAPLRLISASPGNFILGDEFIRNASFAQNAGVVLLSLKKQLQIIDLSTNKTIFKEDQNKDSYGTNYISPNGRLFYIANQEGIKIKSSENGALIATLAANAGAYFSWIDNRFGFYCPQSGDSPVIVDFYSGKEIKLKGIESRVIQAFPIKNTLNNQFIIVGDRHAYKFEAITNDNNVAINLIAETVLKSGNSFAFNTSSTTKDDKYLFSVGTALSIIPVDVFRTKTIDISPFRMQIAVATNNPDEIIIKGYNKDNVSRRRSEHFFLYSITDNTISPITDERASSYRFVHTGSLNSIGVIKKSKIELLDEMAHGTPVALNEFISNLAAEASLKKLQLIEKQKASAPLAAKAKNTQIEAIGVYEGAKHKNGDVTVKVERSTKPIILVLSSYEGVKWHVVKMPGAKIATILLSGYEQSEVIGAGSTRVTNLGRVYAYKNGAYQKLDNEVFKMTGKHIDYFQGRYKGVTFSVGGK